VSNKQCSIDIKALCSVFLRHHYHFLAVNGTSIAYSTAVSIE